MSWFILLLALLASPAHAAKGDAAEVDVAAAQASADAAEREAAAEVTRAAAAETRRQALADAYQREYAWLAAEKRALEARVVEVRAETVRLAADLDAQIASNQGLLIAQTLKADEAERALSDAEEQTAGQEDDALRLTAALEQAEQTLGRPAVGEPTPAERVGQSFALAQGMLQEAGAVTTKTESFFAADGMKLEGRVVRVGLVGTFGVAGDQAGALVPAGGGKLRLHPGPGADVATALAAGSRPAQMGFFFVEKPDQPLVVETDKTVGDVVEDGGTIGLVILVLGALALLLMISRTGLLFGPGRQAVALMAFVEEAAREGRLADLKNRVDGSAGIAGRLLQKVLSHRLTSRADREEVLEEAMLESSATLNRFATPIQVIAAVAPLLGLLGTVTGMIATFDVITTHGTGDPKMLSGGISAALVTTELGLIVAIPCLLVGSLLNARSERILDLIERGGLEALRFVSAAQSLELAATGSTTPVEPGEPAARASV